MTTLLTFLCGVLFLLLGMAVQALGSVTSVAAGILSGLSGLREEEKTRLPWALIVIYGLSLGFFVLGCWSVFS